jgi:hypothetical protein
VRSLSNFALLALVICVGGGCKSVSSTIMDRTPTDNLVSESNGERCHFDQGAPYRGIPVVVRVPTHVDIAIRETLLFTNIENGTVSPKLVQLRPSKRQISVDATLSHSDKLFFVDFKRPAGGTMDYTIDYGDGKSQYFKSIKYKVVDETISDINSALTTVFGTGTPGAQKKSATAPRTAADASKPNTPPGISAGTRMLAWKRFDINEADSTCQRLSRLRAKRYLP